MTTPMTAAQIIMGKLTSRLVQLLIIGLISVPFLMSIRVFGGLEAEVIVALVAITMSATFLMASLGILASVWSRKPASAVAMAFIMFLCLTVAPVVAVIVFMINTRAGPPDEIFAFSAPMAMAAATLSITGGGPQIFLRELWVANSVVNISLGLGAVFVASASLRAVMLSEKALEAPRRKPRRRKAKGARPAGEPGADPAPPESPDEAPETFIERRTVVPDQPVLWRELRQPTLGSRRTMTIAACVLAAVILWIYTEVGPHEQQPHMIVTMTGMFLLLVQAIVGATPSITGEKDASTWLTLLTTPLTPGQILAPKLVGAVKKLWFISAVIGAELLIGFFAGAVNPVLFLHLLMIILGVGVFLGGTGLLFSLKARRSNGASLVNMLMAGLLWIALPLLCGLLETFVFSRGLRSWLRALNDFAFVINPMAMTAVAADSSLSPRRGWSIELPSGTTLNLFEFTGALAGVAAIGCLAGGAAVWLACRRFNRLSGRTS
jgi:ABC-type transport system involved in multi-copper enzyme maturation permease subunit